MKDRGREPGLHPRSFSASDSLEYCDAPCLSCQQAENPRPESEAPIGRRIPAQEAGTIARCSIKTSLPSTRWGGEADLDDAGLSVLVVLARNLTRPSIYAGSPPLACLAPAHPGGEPDHDYGDQYNHTRLFACYSAT
jgi:hypothetical protein